MNKNYVKLKKGRNQLNITEVPDEHMDIMFYVVDKINFRKLEELVELDKKEKANE